MTEEAIKHILIPEHVKISKEEKTALLEKYSITEKELPKISKNDMAIRHLDAIPGDVIKITRTSPTAGKIAFYRGVSNE